MEKQLEIQRKVEQELQGIGEFSGGYTSLEQFHSKSERAKTARKKKAAGRKGKTVVANTKKAKVKLKKGGEVRRIARGCGKVMSDRRKRTKFS